MINYIPINILDMLEYVGEDSCQHILSSFVCPLNPDVEDFIHTKAILFAKQRIAVSYLVFAEQNEQVCQIPMLSQNLTPLYCSRTNTNHPSISVLPCVSSAP